MKHKRIETVMTYEQWHKEYKRNIRKMIRNTLSTCFQWVVITLLFTGLPLGMITHWITTGY